MRYGISFLKKTTKALDIPRYLQLLALLSFHISPSEKVDMAIYETHLGGEFDATNITKNPKVTGITIIALDHMHLGTRQESSNIAG